MSEIESFLAEQGQELDRLENEQVEVIGDSVEECLRLAAKHFGRQIHELDYIILKRGKSKFLFSEPWHIRVSIIPEDEFYNDLMSLDQKLTGGSGKLTSKDLKNLVIPKDRDGHASVKIYRNGVYLIVFPPVGKGKAVTQEEVARKISLKGIDDADQGVVLKTFKAQSGEPVLISQKKPKQGLEAKMMLDISNDNMQARITVTPGKAGGRDLDVKDVVSALKRAGVKYGIKEDDIKEILERDVCNKSMLVAMGDPPKHGANAQIVYHVRTEKKINFKEDPSGKVDYRDMDLIENVVAGQLLAEKIPFEKGIMGRTLFNQLLPAKDGQDVELKQGKGTILSEDRTRLTAEVNGQVVYAAGRLSVETVYKIGGDVGIKSGNVTFLGSVIVTGNVEDNYSIKAAGNVEIYGTVQKANIEADGDIIIRQGVSGRGEARIESTGGNVVAKFIQNANVITDKDVIIQEGIMHSNISAGGKVLCQGKRGQIVGGIIQSAQTIGAKVIGSSANPATELVVGYNPKVIKQIEEYESRVKEMEEQAEKVEKSLKTLKARKETDPASFTESQEDQMNKLQGALEKVNSRMEEYGKELNTLQAYMEEQAQAGAVSVEKTLFGGVKIKIRNAEYETRKEITNKTFIEDGGNIKQIPYEDPNPEKSDWKKKRGRGRIS